MMTVPRLVRSSPALLGRLMSAWEREAATLTAAVTDDEDDLIAAAAVRSLVWAHRIVFRAAMRRLIAGEEPADVARDLRDRGRARLRATGPRAGRLRGLMDRRITHVR